MSFASISPVGPIRAREAAPEVSIYLIDDGNKVGLEVIHCMFCGRPFAGVKGLLTTVVSTPMPASEFSVGVGITCKLCRQTYRILIAA